MKLFDDIECLVPQLPGGTWTHQIIKAQALASLVLGLRPQMVVEIGVFGGASLLPMAMALKETGRGHAIAIDPWSNAAAAEGYDGPNREFWSTCDLNAVFAEFERAMFLTQTHEIISVQRATSDVASAPAEINLLHVDGQHTEQAVKDVLKFAPKVPVGGICIMDDTGWTNGSDQPVKRAVSELLRLGFKSLYALGTGEVFQRVA